MNQDGKIYNGWTNCETWTTAFWLVNDRATHCYWKEATRECKVFSPSAGQVTKGCWTIEEAARFWLADRLKDEVAERSPINEGGLYANLLGAALQRVNWLEIADHYLADN